MASFAKAHNVKLRPHSKTHKSADIARRQIKAGALGVCCAKLGEAEALAEAGIESLHITSPVVTPQTITRLIELNGKIKDLMVVVDHPANVEALAAAAAKAGKPLTVWSTSIPACIAPAWRRPTAWSSWSRRSSG